jgi:predicted dehydrogenase
MGRTHVRAYQEAGASLVGVCDRSAERLSGRVDDDSGNLGTGSGDRLFDPATLRATDDLDGFLASPGLEAVSVCTPTDTHVDVARRVMRAGKHVLVEKPVALNSADVRTLADEADACGVLCMPAMCMRFWPAWAWAADRVRGGAHGAVRAVRLERVGSFPAWGAAFYGDVERSGGALFDLHVHDTDFVVHLLGMPGRVMSVGDDRHMTTVYGYPDGPGQVVATGGWLTSPAMPFRMRMVIEMERGVIDFDLARPEPIVLLDADGARSVPAMDARDGWAMEVEAFVRAVGDGAQSPPATMESAVGTTVVLEAERESLRSGAPVDVGR